MARNKVNVAIIGLGFGTQFIPIYKRHQNANMYAICRRSKTALDAVGDAFGVARRFTRFEDVLQDPEVDFVHINSPLIDHGWMSIAALKAGKQVMCTVPMSMSLDETAPRALSRRKPGPIDPPAERWKGGPRLSAGATFYPMASVEQCCFLVAQRSR